MENVRTWTDKTGSFKVDAEYLGLNNNKVQLYKLNGKVIEVGIDKLDRNDIHYIESIIGQQLIPPSPVLASQNPPELPSRQTDENNDEVSSRPRLPSRTIPLDAPPQLPERMSPNKETFNPPLTSSTSNAQGSTENKTIPIPPPVLPQRPVASGENMPQQSSTVEENINPPHIPQRPAGLNSQPQIPPRPSGLDVQPVIPKRTSTINSTAATSDQAPPQIPSRPMEATRPPKLKSVSKGKSEESRFTWEGFNWKIFFNRIGIDESSAKHYAEKFTRERLGEDILQDIDHDFLKKMGLREGDILKIKKATLEDREKAKVKNYK